MTADVVMQMISTVAFPVCMCLIMAWYIKYQLDQHTKEMTVFREAIDANTKVITQLYEKMEGMNHDGSTGM